MVYRTLNLHTMANIVTNSIDVKISLLYLHHSLRMIPGTFSLLSVSKLLARKNKIIVHITVPNMYRAAVVNMLSSKMILSGSPVGCKMYILLKV